MNRNRWKSRGKRISKTRRIMCIACIIITVVIFIITLAVYILTKQWSTTITVLTVCAAMIQAVILAISLHSDTVTKRFEFIEEYNFNFLTSNEFQEVERKLETCFQLSKKYHFNKTGKLDFRKKCFDVFNMCDRDIENNRLKNSEIGQEYQNIVNYLVYLESFAPLIMYNRVDLNEIDDLYGYRYFIAMNNPVIQEMELFPFRDYYNGCFSIYERWKEHRCKNKSLSEIMPLESFDLLSRWEIYKRRNRIKRID